jgi:hypothetical protein
MRRFLGYSWVGWLNMLVLQWWLICLQVALCAKTGKSVRWKLIGPLVPLTGWWSPYVWLWRRKDEGQ